MMKVYFYNEQVQGNSGRLCSDDWRIDSYESEAGCDDIRCYEFATADELEEELQGLDKQIESAGAGTDLFLMRIREGLSGYRDEI